jgi:hypothetical protein
MYNAFRQHEVNCHGYFMIFFHLLMLLFAASPAKLCSQVSEVANDEGRVVFEFVRSETILPGPGSFFNVVNIVNLSDKQFSGMVKVAGPEGWRVIGGESFQLELLPGEESLVPVRMVVPHGMLGGISYAINAELRSTEYYDYTTSYVSLVPVSKWDIHLDKDQVFLSDFSPSGVFRIQLSNKGNSNEMIKLSFDTGDLLEYVNPMPNDSLLFVELPAYMDTVIVFSVREKQGVSYAEQRALTNNWRAMSIRINASTPEQRRSTGIRIVPLESQLLSDRRFRDSPLNIDLTLNNLLSFQQPKMAARVDGKILFPESQVLQYNFGVNNIYFDSERNRDFDLYRQVRFRIQYNDVRTSVSMGDRLGIGDLHAMNGQGIRAQHTLNDNSTVFFNAVNNPINKNLAFFTGYQRAIKSILINTGFTVESKMNTPDNHFSYAFGSSFGFLKYHKLNLNTITTLSRFGDSPYLQGDTTLLGFAYRISYDYKRNRFDFRVDNMNTRMSYLNNSGINRLNIRSNFYINNQSIIRGIYYRNSYDAMRYPYNFFYPGNKNINDNGNLYYSLNRGKIIYNTGPSFINTVRYYFNPVDGFYSVYRNLQPGLFGSVSFKAGLMQSITPYLRLNTMFVNYSSDDPDFEPYRLRGKLQYTAGLSYYDEAFKLTAYFSSGEASDIYRSVVVERIPEVNQSFHIRPYYERYFNRESIRMSAYLNYSYYMPSMRENMIFNLTSDFFMDHGWRIFLSFNLYRIVRTDEFVGRISTRDMNVLTGIRKSFDIQQPRLKYYDVTIVGFNDQNGNGIKDANEKPIPNVLIQIARDPKRNLMRQTSFREITLITDPNGEIFHEDMPEGLYNLTITPLSNLENLFFLNGVNQQMFVSGDMIHYLPLVESYRVRGRIIVDRDPNSSEGKISLEGIRVTAVGEDGETYSALTDSYGGYVLHLPKAANYEVSIYNIFGEQFILEQSSYKIQFSANKTVSLDFKFTERRRQLQYRDGEQYFDFNLRRDQ